MRRRSLWLGDGTSGTFHRLLGWSWSQWSFGGIHCIAWSFAFPSSTEQLLWRISSIAITGIPLPVAGILFHR